MIRCLLLCQIQSTAPSTAGSTPSTSAPAGEGELRPLKYMLGSGELRKLNYSYDVFGNMRRQTPDSGQTQGDFAYDSLQRLVSSIRSGAASARYRDSSRSGGSLVTPEEWQG